MLMLFMLGLLLVGFVGFFDMNNFFMVSRVNFLDMMVDMDSNIFMSFMDNSVNFLLNYGNVNMLWNVNGGGFSDRCLSLLVVNVVGWVGVVGVMNSLMVNEILLRDDKINSGGEGGAIQIGNELLCGVSDTIWGVILEDMQEEIVQSTSWVGEMGIFSSKEEGNQFGDGFMDGSSDNCILGLILNVFGFCFEVETCDNILFFDL